MEYNKEDLNWLMRKIDSATKRYMFSENEILNIINMPWYKRIFCGKRLVRHLQNHNWQDYKMMMEYAAKKKDGVPEMPVNTPDTPEPRWPTPHENLPETVETKGDMTF